MGVQGFSKGKSELLVRQTKRKTDGLSRKKRQKVGNRVRHSELENKTDGEIEME